MSLAKLDAAGARPVLEVHAAAGNPRVAALALSLLYQNAADPRDSLFLRQRLIAIAVDPTAAGFARDRVIDVLLESEWDGRDDWYLTLLEDPTLGSLSDGVFGYSPLQALAQRDPDRWIPRLAQLLNGPRKAVHDNVVEILVSFNLEQARVDALRPLVPWIANPEWSSASDRLRLIQSAARAGLVEAVPALKELVVRDSGWRAEAADALGDFAEAGVEINAVDALLQALREDPRPLNKAKIARAVLATGEISADQLADAIEAFAELVGSPGGQERWSNYLLNFGDVEPLDPLISLGAAAAADEFTPSPQLVETLLVRLAAAREREAPSAGVLQGIVSQWLGPSVDADVVRQLEVGQPTLELILAALDRRESLAAALRPRLLAMVSHGGSMAGIAAAILGEASPAAELLAGRDLAAQAGLLAGARRCRATLPVALVEPLLWSASPLMAEAADRYLEALDRPEAREALLRRSPGEARILGARMTFDPGHDSYPHFEEWEARLRDQVLDEDGAEEIFALLGTGYWGGGGEWQVAVRDGRARLTVRDDEVRRRERDLDSAELDALRAFLVETGVEDLGPLALPVSDGLQYEYVHVTAAGGRRVFMNNPGSAPGSPYHQLTKFFRGLEAPAPMVPRNASPQD